MMDFKMSRNFYIWMNLLKRVKDSTELGNKWNAYKILVSSGEIIPVNDWVLVKFIFKFKMIIFKWVFLCPLF